METTRSRFEAALMS
jgi:hypothetical protein